MGGLCARRLRPNEFEQQVDMKRPATEPPRVEHSVPAEGPATKPPRVERSVPAEEEEEDEVPTRYTATWMSPEELAQLSVPFANVKTALRPVLEEYGMAVVTDVISTEAELKELESMFHEDLLQIIDEDAIASSPAYVQQAYDRFRSEGPAAFPVRTAGVLTAAAGFVLERCLCHGKFAWACRRHPRVHEVFDAIFNEGPLVTSLDATFFTPAGAEHVNRNEFSAHVDQNKHDARTTLATCEVYQGVLYVWPSTQGCSTTAAWPRSHREVYPEMMQDKTFQRSGEDGIHYSEIEAMQDRQKAAEIAGRWLEEARLCTVPAGSLLLWNSRTVHTGWKSGARLAQTVCLEPAARRPIREQVSKMRLAALGLPSTHWASYAMQHDMTLYSHGCFTGPDPKMKYPEQVQEHDQVRLPLKSSISPLALREDSDIDGLKTLIEVNFSYTGMWSPTVRAKELLERSVKDEFKQFL